VTNAFRVRCETRNLRIGHPLTQDKTLEHLQDYRECADRLFAVAKSGAVEQAARVLALYVGYYQRRHGVISISDLETLSRGSPTIEHAADLAEGMRCLAAALTLANTMHT
jgi:hypothetical protein